MTFLFLLVGGGFALSNSPRSCVFTCQLAPEPCASCLTLRRTSPRCAAIPRQDEAGRTRRPRSPRTPRGGARKLCAMKHSSD